jgi:hypothetical protein
VNGNTYPELLATTAIDPEKYARIHLCRPANIATLVHVPGPSNLQYGPSIPQVKAIGLSRTVTGAWLPAVSKQLSRPVIISVLGIN